jgi:tetratricopeptide (TPR) repeat protein
MGAPATVVPSHQPFTPGNIRHPQHPSTGSATADDATGSNDGKNAAKSLEETYTSLIQEYLQVMCLDNATFLAERMAATCQTTNAWYLLAVCHFRSQSPHRALTVLENIKVKTSASAYLVAKCCYEVHQYGRAEEALLEAARADYREYKANYGNPNDPYHAHGTTTTHSEGGGAGGNKLMTMDEWLMETSPCPIPNGAAGLYLLGCVCRRSNRKRRAMEYLRMSLQVRTDFSLRFARKPSVPFIRVVRRLKKKLIFVLL